MNNTTSAPPFSLPLLAGMVFRPFLFRPPLQKTCDLLVWLVQHRHPNIFERLLAYSNTHILVNPLDLPYCLLLHIGENTFSVRLLKDEGEGDITPDATIRSNIASLLRMMEGKIDGDALFFSRELHITGDTEIVVALRNAFDSENINLADDILKLLGPFSRQARFVTRHIESVLTTMSSDIKKIQGACIQPTQRYCDSLAQQVTTLQQQVSRLEKTVNRTQSLRKPAAQT